MLGFEDDVTVVATGHQAAIWHPGILVKNLAVRALVESLAATGRAVRPLHFIADHDANDGGLVAYPTTDVRRGGWRMLPPTDRSSTIDRPAGRPAAVPRDAIEQEDVRRGLEAIHAAVARHAELGPAAVHAALDGGNRDHAQAMQPVQRGLYELCIHESDLQLSWCT